MAERIKYQGIEDKISHVESLVKEITPEKYLIDVHPHRPWITLSLKDTGAKAIIVYPVVNIIAVYDEGSSALADRIADQYKTSISDISVRKRFGREAMHEH